MPPYSGPTQVLFLHWVPFAHVTEQSDQSAHAVHTPSTRKQRIPRSISCKKKGFVKNITVSNVYIPGQGCSLHFLDSSECPIHVSPPCRGKLHSRVRFCMPPPQVTEQLSHPFHVFHEPSTKMTRWIMQIDRERDHNHFTALKPCIIVLCQYIYPQVVKLYSSNASTWTGKCVTRLGFILWSIAFFSFIIWTFACTGTVSGSVTTRHGAITPLHPFVPHTVDCKRKKLQQRR